MSYQKALEAAGATVHQFKEFGSYQGDWFALVTANGVTGWIQGSYGSCSGCDSFEAEFNYERGECDQHAYAPKAECLGCQEAERKMDARLVDFGKTYLDCIESTDAILAKLQENIEWDSEAQEAIDWVRKISLT
jgi:hypothetical protein